MSDGENYRTLADAARAHGLRYGHLYYTALKRGMKPVQIVADRKLYSDAQVQQLIADLAGQATASIQGTPEGSALEFSRRLPERIDYVG